MNLELGSLLFGSLSVISFGIVAGAIGHKRYYSSSSRRLTNVDFVTARNSLGVLVIAWSIYSNAVGAVTAFFPPSYASSPGIGFVGVGSNVISNILPPFLIYFFGSKIREQYPEALSLSHFMRLRYGKPSVQYLISIIVVFNMAMALTIEYAAISSIYKDLVDTHYAIGVCILIAVITSAYTAYGGLYASLATDQWQGVASTILLIIICTYTAFFSNIKLGEFPAELNPDQRGFSSIFVLPISIVTGTILSEASFQRAWAAYDTKTLRTGAIIGSLLIGLVIFVFSMGGIIAVWAGRTVTNPNNILFALVGPPHAPTFITVLVVVIATIMSTSAVDSIQNGMVAAITSNFLVDKPVLYSRVLAVILNAICFALGFIGLDIVTLFAITNIITTMASVFFAGLFVREITGTGCIFGFIFSLVNLVGFGWYKKGDFVEGMYYIWIEEKYNYPPFLIALTSFIGMSIWEFCVYAFKTNTDIEPTTFPSTPQNSDKIDYRKEHI